MKVDCPKHDTHGYHGAVMHRYYKDENIFAAIVAHGSAIIA